MAMIELFKQRFLPIDFCGIALLDHANITMAHHESERGDTPAHPFDSKTGAERLREHILDHENTSYARSAITALPYIDKARARPLLEAASRYPDRSIRLHNAWAVAKHGFAAGIVQLTKALADQALRAQVIPYLHDLGREDLLPDDWDQEAEEALVQFAEWCRHPNEFQAAPDSISIAYDRTLAFPMGRQEMRFILVRYRFDNPFGNGPEQGIGMASPMPFCTRSQDIDAMSIKEVLGWYVCLLMCLALKQQDPSNDIEPDAETGLDLLKEVNPGVDL